MNKNIALVLLAFLLGGLAAFGRFWYTRSLPLEKSYQDVNGRFSFGYPEGWEVIPDQDLVARNERFTAGVMRSSEPSTACGVVVTPGNDPLDLKAIARAFDERLAKDFQDFQKHGQDIQTISGSHRLYYDYTYTHLGKEPVHQIQGVMQGNGQYYTVSCSTLKDRWLHYRKTFLALLNSFQEQ